jgi:hypothetical protein
MSGNLIKFMGVLADQYAVLFKEQPQVYSLAAQRYSPSGLAEKMTMSLKKREGDKDGEGIKRTCKALGIPHTYKAIEAYLL